MWLPSPSTRYGPGPSPRRHPGRPRTRVRLPARGLGRRALPPAARPVLAEPAPRRRLERPVRRLRRAATPPRPARPLRHPGHHPPRHAAHRSPPPPTTRCGGRPSTDQRYTADQPPVWDERRRAPGSTRTPASRCTTWAEALDAIDDDPDAEPAHVVRFGAQVDAKGVMPGTERRRTDDPATSPSTSPSTPATATPPTTDRQRAHLDRLWHELRVTPCSDRCANWLLYGIQPKKAHAKLQPGPLQGQGPPAGHPRHRRPAHPRLPRLVRQDPRRPPRTTPAPGSAPSSASPPTSTTPATARPTTTPARRRPGTPGNSPDPTTPTSHRWTTGSCAPSPNGRNGAPNSSPRKDRAAQRELSATGANGEGEQ